MPRTFSLPLFTRVREGDARAERAPGVRPLAEEAGKVGPLA